MWLLAVCVMRGPAHTMHLPAIQWPGLEVEYFPMAPTASKH